MLVHTSSSFARMASFGSPCRQPQLQLGLANRKLVSTAKIFYEGSLGSPSLPHTSIVGGAQAVAVPDCIHCLQDPARTRNATTSSGPVTYADALHTRSAGTNTFSAGTSRATNGALAETQGAELPPLDSLSRSFLRSLSVPCKYACGCYLKDVLGGG
uniref:Uncharacterized protein n=1 Tax=Haptolina brevifila TaxID=156173 RepID=A0A7S2NBE6_9EUKA|mmetsp:Transcript_72601/g.144208  ORF Transcript_72601/g.144208 Transcript_72601/m.144208 type:complete len:157 (+) Transcript_72601:263-733(+)